MSDSDSAYPDLVVLEDSNRPSDLAPDDYPLEILMDDDKPSVPSHFVQSKDTSPDFPAQCVHVVRIASESVSSLHDNTSQEHRTVAAYFADTRIVELFRQEAEYTQIFFEIERFDEPPSQFGGPVCAFKKRFVISRSQRGYSRGKGVRPSSFSIRVWVRAKTGH